MFGHLLDSPRTRFLASAISLALGLFFTLVWAPHPWPWEGIDQYHDLARALANGEGFRTTDVPWGYAYYLAAFYVLFGVKPLFPILGQVLANATMPLLLFALIKPLAGQRTATLSALIVGVFSFNTVYASTQISDVICSVLFLGAAVCFQRGHASRRMSYFAASGVLAGLTPQFRPNLVLLPGLVAALYLLWMWRTAWRPVRQATAHAVVFLSLSTLALVPWVVRNYLVTDTFLPSSSHGGIQLWYGSLQVGPYLENFSINPRTAFAAPVLDYTSLAGKPIVVSATIPQCGGAELPALSYWTDRNPDPARLTPSRVEGRAIEFAIPGQPDPTVVHWRVEAAGREPIESVYFVSSDHMGDLDRQRDWLDVFDVIRLTRHVAWQEASPPGRFGDVDLNGRIDRDDLAAMVFRLVGFAEPEVAPLKDLAVDAASAQLTFSDGSTMRVPRASSGLVTDLDVRGTVARRLLTARLLSARAWAPPGPQASCEAASDIRFNDVFYRRELQHMRRYTTLAFDNIRREPLAFGAAALYRSVRLFIVRPEGEHGTTYRFAGGRLIYSSALVLSLGYFLLFLTGVVVAWRRRSALLVLLAPIVYVPATICFVLTNQRYTVTVQPLMFAFVALALVTVLRLDEKKANGTHQITR